MFATIPSMVPPLTYQERFTTLLAKITKRKYAGKLMQGDVRMNTLHSYSAFANESNSILGVGEPVGMGTKGGKHGIQVDDCEGALCFVDPANLTPDFHSLLDGAPKEVQAKAHSPFYLEQNTLPYLRLYCMYMLVFDTWREQPTCVDIRLRDFGDTVVLFTDPRAFLTCLARAIYKKHGYCCYVDAQPVEYLPDDNYSLRNEFCKRDVFKWQHEYRLSAGALDVPVWEIGPEDDPSQHMIRTLEPWSIGVGDLSDIAVMFPLEELFI